MYNDSKHIATLVLVVALALLAGCNDGPTSSSDFDTVFSGGARGPRALAVEQFNCTNIEEVHVRFSDPGSVDGATVRLWYSYRGVPDGVHTLSAIWDEQNFHDDFPQKREPIDIAAATTPNPIDGLVDIQGTFDHTYPSVEEDTTRTVRVVLTMENLTGDCSTVRRIVQKVPVEPPAKPGQCNVNFAASALCELE